MNPKMMKLREKLYAQNIQGMIVSNPVSIKYLLNIDAEGILLMTRKENIYITDGRYIEDVNANLTIEDEIVVYDMRTLMEEDYENFFMFCENVGFEEEYITVAKYNKMMQMYKCNLVETEGIVEKIRIIKNEEEIEYIKKACEITDDCFYHLTKFIEPGMTEIEIATEIYNYFRKRGGDGEAFPSIVASGANSSKPHAIPTERKIGENDIILIDMGCKYKGYCADMTRTIFVGTVPESVKVIYECVLKNQQLVLKEIRDGRGVKDIAKVSETDLELNKHNLIHALGHGVGLEVHEMPVLSSKSGAALKTNTIIAVEPGIYIGGKFGVRIEDTVLVTKDGCITLTKAGKDYTIIEKKIENKMENKIENRMENNKNYIKSNHKRQ